jgi:glycine betaine/proline transport system substrate-binding protein
MRLRALVSLLWRWSMLLAGGVSAAGLIAYMYVHGPGYATDGDSVGMAEIRTPGQTSAVPRAVGRGTVRIGWTAWTDAEVVTQIAKRLLEGRFGLDVPLVMADIGIQYQAVARGDLDVMLMAWLPVTHREYWSRVRDDVVNLGSLYTGRLGWVVPDYVPIEALASIEDLNDPQVARRIGFRVQGIDPGSGLMQASERAVREYDLEQIRLVAASGAAMTAVLDRAMRRGEWVVVTGWRPHWMFARYDLRFLEDPRGVLGGHERVNVVVREGFENAVPAEVIAFLSRLYLPEDDLARILLRAQDVPVERAAAEYLDAHPRRVRYWLTGELAEEPPEQPSSIDALP